MGIPKILEKVMRFKAITHKDGKLYLWGVPGLLNQLYVVIYQYKLMEKTFGEKEAASILYAMGYLQAKQGYKIISKRFGYAKTIPDKVRFLKFNSAQTDVVGAGHFEWVRIDFKKNLFILKGKTSISSEYKKFFGKQNKCVDHFTRGQMTAYIEELTGKKCFTIETRCQVKGNPYCEFVCKPIKHWDKKSKEYKEQQVIPMPDLASLGAKMEPYLIGQNR